MKKRIPAAVLTLSLCASLASPAAALDLSEALELLEQNYVDPLPAAVYDAGSIDELLRILDDPYTVYYTPEQYDLFLSAINGETLVGIGVTIQNAFDNGFEILSVLPDSPALDAGLIPGEVITAVNGFPLSPADTPSAHIAGEEGEPVTLTLRAPDGTIRDVTMTRRPVQIPIVTHQALGSAGYIDCTSFGSSTYDGVKAALNDLEPNTATWIMDLRENHGGTAEAAAAAASLFVGKALMVNFRDGQDLYYQTATTNLSVDMTDQPLILLTGARSASAAELFAAAMRDHRAAIAIGARTYGKGIAQKIFDDENMPERFDGDAMKITAFRFYSPNGAANHVIGVLPTLVMDERYALAAARLISAPVPERSLHNVKLELCGQTFYFDLPLARENPEVLTVLLESLPPSALLYAGTGTNFWREITPAELAETCGARYRSPFFADLDGHPFRDEINTLSSLGLLAGTDDGNFFPDAPLTRARLCGMLQGILDLPVPEAPAAFADVPSDAWYADALAALTERGFLSGSGDGRFFPDAVVTAQELHTVCSAIAVWCSMEGYELSKEDLYANDWGKFYRYPAWAQIPARNMHRLGIEVDREHPDAPVTAAQAAGQLYQLLKQLDLLWGAG